MGAHPPEMTLKLMPVAEKQRQQVLINFLFVGFVVDHAERL
jgi:hypothetical protein